MSGRPLPPPRCARLVRSGYAGDVLAAADVTATDVTGELALGDLDGRGAQAVRPAVKRAATVAHAHTANHADLADLGIRTNHFLASFGLSSSRTTCAGEPAFRMKRISPLLSCVF